MTSSTRRLLAGWVGHVLSPLPLATAGAVAALVAVPAPTAAATHAASSLASESTNAAGVRPQLPPPDGPYRVGKTDLHLIDRDRDDPWVEGETREIMASVWYPALPTHGQPRAPWMRQAAAANFEKGAARTLQVSVDRLDLAGMTTHARVGAPALPGGRGRSVVLYSPGFGSSRATATTVVEELTSHGYVVVTMDHTYETSVVEFPGDRIEVQTLPSVEGPDKEMTRTERQKIYQRARRNDASFVLDQLTVIDRGGNPDAAGGRLPRGLGRALDLSRVGMYGHSAGGITALETMAADQRVDAGINLDGPLNYTDWGGDDALLPIAERGLKRPTMFMGARLPETGQLQTHRTARSWEAFRSNSPGWKLDLNLPKGRHNSYTDYQSIVPQLDEQLELPEGFRHGYIGSVDPRGSIDAQRAYITAFFEEHLRHRPQPLLNRPSPQHPEVRFIR